MAAGASSLAPPWGTRSPVPWTPVSPATVRHCPLGWSCGSADAAREPPVGRPGVGRGGTLGDPNRVPAPRPRLARPAAAGVAAWDASRSSPDRALRLPPRRLPGARRARSLPLGSGRAGGFGLAARRGSERGAGASERVCVSHPGTWSASDADEQLARSPNPKPSPSARRRPGFQGRSPGSLRSRRPRGGRVVGQSVGAGPRGGMSQRLRGAPATLAIAATDTPGHRHHEPPVRPLRESRVSHRESQLPGQGEWGAPALHLLPKFGNVGNGDADADGDGETRAIATAGVGVPAGEPETPAGPQAQRRGNESGVAPIGVRASALRRAQAADHPGEKGTCSSPTPLLSPESPLTRALVPTAPPNPGTSRTRWRGS